MDNPQDVGASGRDSLHTVMQWENWAIAYADITGGTYTTGLPGVTIDSRTSAQPTYTNGISSGIDSSLDFAVDQGSLSAPNSPGIFIGDKGAGSLSEFVRIFTGDITDGNIGLWIQKVRTDEDCDNPGYRWILCSKYIEG